jgi:hypothetical protein
MVTVHELALAEGRTYVGAVQAGKPHGQGVMTWANGDKYEGEFDEGWMDGDGVLTCVDGRVFMGQFLCDRPHFGTMTWANGDSFEGHFYEGDIDKDQTGKFTRSNGVQVQLTPDSVLYDYLQLGVGQYDVSLPCANPDRSEAVAFIESFVNENLENRGTEIQL